MKAHQPTPLHRPEPTSRPEVRQLDDDALAPIATAPRAVRAGAGLDGGGGLAGLASNHPTAGVARAAAVLGLQRFHGNAFVARLIANPAPAADAGVCPVCGRRGRGTCACGEAFVPAQRALEAPPISRSRGQTLRRKSTATPDRPGDRPPPVNATERATPENRQLAELIDALDEELPTFEKLAARREKALTEATGTRGDDQRRHLQTLEAIEFLAARRGLKKLELTTDRPSTRRRNVRVSIEERVRTLGSFKKAKEEFSHDRTPTKEIQDHLEFFQEEVDRFQAEFRGQAYQTADRMLEESKGKVYKVAEDYGLPVAWVRNAADRLALGSRGSTVETEAQKVVDAAKNPSLSKGVDAPDKVQHRMSLADDVEELKKHQQAVKTHQQTEEDLIKLHTKDPSTVTTSRAKEVEKELAGAHSALRAAWINAERRHPVLAAYRGGGELEKVDLGTLDTAPAAEGQMQAVLKQLLPKLVDIDKAKGLLKSKRDFALTLPSVVALTRANMFVPEGSIRAGAANDLAEEAKGDDHWVQLAALALALVTLLPSAGASAAVASAGFAAYSAAKEWGKFTTQKTLVNTDLELARSLSTDEPSLAGFALNLVELGFEGVPLVSAFKKASRIRNLVNRAPDVGVVDKDTWSVVKELNKIGRKHKPPVPDLGDRALRESGGLPAADLAAVGMRAREELQRKYGADLAKLYEHAPSSHVWTTSQVEEFLTWKQKLDGDTQRMFIEDPSRWRTWAEMDPGVRKLLTNCTQAPAGAVRVGRAVRAEPADGPVIQRACIPPGAGPAQTKRISDMLTKFKLPADDPGLNGYFRRHAAQLDEAIEHLEDAKSLRDLRTRLAAASDDLPVRTGFEASNAAPPAPTRDQLFASVRQAAARDPEARRGLHLLETQIVSHSVTRQRVLAALSEQEVVGFLRTMTLEGIGGYPKEFYVVLARSPEAMEFAQRYGRDAFQDILRVQGRFDVAAQLERARPDFQRALDAFGKASSDDLARMRARMRDRSRVTRPSHLDAILGKGRARPAASIAPPANANDPDWRRLVERERKFARTHAPAADPERPLSAAELAQRAALRQTIERARNGGFDQLAYADRLSLLAEYDRIGRETRMAQTWINNGRGALAEALFVPRQEGRESVRTLWRGGRVEQRPLRGEGGRALSEEEISTIPDYAIPAVRPEELRPRAPGERPPIESRAREWVELKSNRIDAGNVDRGGAYTSGRAAATQHLDDARRDLPNLPAGSTISLHYVRDPLEPTRSEMLRILAQERRIERVRFAETWYSLDRFRAGR
jgi:hypothetical protein